MVTPLALGSIIVFAALDRLWGSDIKIAGHSGHSIATLACVLLAIGAYFITPLAVGLIIAWAIYRSLPNFGGSIAPKPGVEYLFTIARHLIAPILATLALLATGHDMLGAWPFGVYALAAVLIAMLNGIAAGSINWIAETARGGIYGGAFAIAVGWISVPN